MNKFKSLLLLCMVFAFASMSNQGFCSGDPVSVNVMSPCTGTVVVTQACNGDDSDVTITLSGSTGDDATVTVSGGYVASPVALGMANGSFTLTIPAADLPASITVAVNISGAGCEAASVNPTPDPTTIDACASTCQDCFEVDALIEDANGAAEGGEVCGMTTQLFEVGNDLTSNGMVGSAAMPNRNVTFEFGNSATLMAGFEVFAGSEFLCTNAPISCAAALAPDSETAFSAPVTVDAQVKIMPNPVTNIAQIQYNMAVEGRVQVSVFDMKGNQVAVVANGTQASGMHTVEFDSSNLSAGFYYLTVRTANSQTTERLVIVK